MQGAGWNVKVEVVCGTSVPMFGMFHIFFVCSEKYGAIYTPVI